MIDLLNLFLISLILVFIIDLSGIVQEIEGLLTKFLHSPLPLSIPKPFSCSLCMTFWCGLLYLLITSNFNLMFIAFVCLLAFMTTVLGRLMWFLKDCGDKVLELFERWFNIK